jgi:biopolymer transport protein ExbD
MKFKKKETNEEIGFQVASMIDIVFLLLIFFIVASQLQDLELEKQVSLPIADSAQAKKSDGVQEILINVLSNGVVKVSGTELPMEKLSEELRKVAESSDKADKKIIIRGDKNAHYGRMMNIMRSCAQAGLWNVSFAAFQEAEQKEQY